MCTCTHRLVHTPFYRENSVSHHGPCELRASSEGAIGSSQTPRNSNNCSFSNNNCLWKRQLALSQSSVKRDCGHLTGFTVAVALAPVTKGSAPQMPLHVPVLAPSDAAPWPPPPHPGPQRRPRSRAAPVPGGQGFWAGWALAPGGMGTALTTQEGPRWAEAPCPLTQLPCVQSLLPPVGALDPRRRQAWPSRGEGPRLLAPPATSSKPGMARSDSVKGTLAQVTVSSLDHVYIAVALKN